jgi:hypothetical protein
VERLSLGHIQHLLAGREFADGNDLLEVVIDILMGIEN